VSPAEKVCPIIFRGPNASKEILVFRHPLAGVQLVKGTVEENEDFEAAALRELAEESGITRLTEVRFKGTLDFEEIAQRWHFFLCTAAEELPDAWDFFANDDGGINFSFFWVKLFDPPSEDWHPAHRKALDFIRGNFPGGGNPFEKQETEHG
jgi:8-oxo-dGTP pyrophosphatase MutT (NUDIX family)